MSDLNAKIGKEAMFRPIIDSHSLHETTNDNGLRLIDFVCENGLVVKSTMFPRKDIYKHGCHQMEGMSTKSTIESEESEHKIQKLHSKHKNNERIRW